MGIKIIPLENSAKLQLNKAVSLKRQAHIFYILSWIKLYSTKIQKKL
jgi:hypothetical protein